MINKKNTDQDRNKVRLFYETLTIKYDNFNLFLIICVGNL